MNVDARQAYEVTWWNKVASGRVNEKLPQGKTSQKKNKGQGQQFKVQNMHVKMGISTFKLKKPMKCLHQSIDCSFQRSINQSI